MNKKTKSTLSFTFCVVTFILIVGLLLFVTNKVSPLVLAIGLIVLETLVAIPAFNIGFYNLYQEDMGYKKFLNFVPYLNYFISVNKVYEIISHCIVGIFIALLSVLLIPSLLTNTSEIFALQVYESYPVILFVIIFVLNVIIGVALYSCTCDVKEIERTIFDDEGNGFVYKLLGAMPKLEILLLIFPVFRLVALYSSIDTLYTLKNMGITYENVLALEEAREE